MQALRLYKYCQMLVCGNNVFAFLRSYILCNITYSLHYYISVCQKLTKLMVNFQVFDSLTVFNATRLKTFSCRRNELGFCNSETLESCNCEPKIVLSLKILPSSNQHRE